MAQQEGNRQFNPKLHGKGCRACKEGTIELEEYEGFEQRKLIYECNECGWTKKYICGKASSTKPPADIDESDA